MFNNSWYDNSFSLPVLVVFLLVFVTPVMAQDARVSQYIATPLLVNPAQTGDFEGKVRMLGLFARVDNDVSFNNIYNTSIDWRIGENGSWALGLNYMQSGTSRIPLSGKYTGVSLGREFFLDKNKIQELRLGFQASYLQGKVDEEKGPYDRLLDVRAFRYWLPEEATGDYKGKAAYLNYSVGAKYKFSLNRLKIESGFSAYNITNPDYNIMYNGVMLKRYRVAALSSIYYQPDPKDAFKIEHFSWKEGIYLRDYKPVRDSATEIHETTYSLTWYRYMPRKTFNLGVYSRSWESVYGMIGMNINQKFGFSLSYEAPLYRKYYNVSHIEFSLHIFPFGKKKKSEDSPAKLSGQMNALLPFGTNFCLPCLAGNPSSDKPVPDSVKSEKTKCAGDSVNQIARTQVPFTDSLKNVSKQNLLQPTTDSASVVVMPHLPVRTPMVFKDTIYYDFDKYNIRPDAAVKLNKIIDLMKSQPSLSLDVRSHTDLRGNVAYNETLSKNRSNAVVQYLVKAGIDRGRIMNRWYGEQEPLNNCEKCNDMLQQKNRRSELSLHGFEEPGMNYSFFGSERLSRKQLLEHIRDFVDLDIASSPEPDTGASLQNGNQVYTIQIGEFGPVETDSMSYLMGLNVNVFNQKDPNGYSRYFFGIFYDRSVAEDMLVKIKNLGFKGAYIRKAGSRD